MLFILGWNHGSMLFSNMARDDAKRDKFVTTTVDFLLKHKFDGLGECFNFFSLFYLVCITSTAIPVRVNRTYHFLNQNSKLS